MADVSPFCGIRYNQSAIGDLSAVICPPYDIVTPQMRHELYQRSEYNFIRLEDSWGSPEDSVLDSKYTRSVATLERWLEQGILRVDEVPAIHISKVFG